jgi:hypothetical protein
LQSVRHHAAFASGHVVSGPDSCFRADNNHGLCHDLSSGLVNDLASGLADGLARPSDLASDLARTIVYGLESAMVTWSGACLWS